jgi:hypothetical protein
MALKARLTPDEFNTLPEHFKTEYKEQDGVYCLAVDPVTYKDAEGKEQTLALENVTGLKTALSRERTAAAELAKQLKAYEGVPDPEAAKVALQKVKEWGEADPSEKLKKQLEAVKEQFEQRFRGEITGLTTRLAAEQKANEQLIEDTKRLVIDNAASAALTKFGVIPEAHESMVREIREVCRARRVEAAGKLQHHIEIMDAGGNIRITNAPNSTDPMGMEELVKEMRAGRFAYAFKATQAQGSGGGSGTNVKLTAETKNLDPVERLKLARRAQAGVA